MAGRMSLWALLTSAAGGSGATGAESTRTVRSPSDGSSSAQDSRRLRSRRAGQRRRRRLSLPARLNVGPKSTCREASGRLVAGILLRGSREAWNSVCADTGFRHIEARPSLETDRRPEALCTARDNGRRQPKEAPAIGRRSDDKPMYIAGRRKDDRGAGALPRAAGAPRLHGNVLRRRGLGRFSRSYRR